MFFIEIQNFENKAITSALSSMISFLTLYNIELSEVFLIFDFDKFGINDEIFKIYTLAWTRSIPAIIGGMIVYFFNNFNINSFRLILKMLMKRRMMNFFVLTH